MSRTVRDEPRKPWRKEAKHARKTWWRKNRHAAHITPDTPGPRKTQGWLTH